MFLDGLTSDCSVVGVAAGSVVGTDDVGVASWSSGVMLVVVVGVESPIVGFCG